MSDKVKKQHYVPQVYLRYFATPETASHEDDKKRIHAYMKEEGEQLDNQPVSGVAAENYFYDMPFDDAQVVEKWLGKDVEGRVGPILKKLVETQSVDALSYSELHDLAFFLSVQHHCTRKFRSLQSESTRNLLDAAKNHPQHFEDFIKENSQYTVPDVEAMLSKEHIELATRRLEALQLPPDQRAARMAELDTELERLNQITDEIKRDMENYKQGKPSDELMEMLKHNAENPSVAQARSLKMSVPKLAQRLTNMEWSIQKYRQDDFRLTSDSPLLLIPLGFPASEDDWGALELFHLTSLGEVHFYTDELVEDHPPMMFVFPLTPHLDLFISPDRDGFIGKALLGENAESWNEAQVMQARRFVFSAHRDFSVVSKAVELYLGHKQMVEELIPARMQAEPRLNKKQPRDKRWVVPGDVNN